MYVSEANGAQVSEIELDHYCSEVAITSNI